jgi:hypothetical protein
MKKPALGGRRSRRRNWEREALARVAAHVAAIDCYRPQPRELGWERAAFERLRTLLKHRER